MFKIVQEEILTNKKSGVLTCFFMINYRCGRYLYLFRKKSKYSKWLLFIPYALCLFLAKLMSSYIGGSLPFSASVGKNLRLPHGLNGVFISGLATIGNDCTILHQVTIGSNLGRNKKTYASPQIGNNVFIGAGAKIIGDLVLGNGCLVGSNALVVKSVPDGRRCLAPEAKVLIIKG